jgi:miniconductance mechanosensitive channel
MGDLIAGFQDWASSLLDHPAVAAGLALAVVLFVAGGVLLIVRRVVLPLLCRLTTRIRTCQDLIEQGLFRRLSWLAPLVVVNWGISFVPSLPEELSGFLARLVLGLTILIAVRAVDSLLAALHVIYCRSPLANSRPIKGYLQAINLVMHIVGGLFILSGFLGQSPWYLLSGVGAMMAVLLLIFRDTLLGLVAGFQLTKNDLIRVNDWIEMPQFGADGDVVDIALNTVKVRNWDNTVTVIPSHKFLEHSFKNWRAMHEIGGRRIRRSINIDMTSVRFLDQDEIEKFGRFALLSDYFRHKLDEIAAHNEANKTDPQYIPNERRLTNLGTFRAYVDAYLRSNPLIHQELTFLVRQLQPTAEGLPLEIYVYTTDTRWVAHEGIQADIFDHLLAILPEFGLKVFQDPTGSDFTALASAGAREAAPSPSAV